MCSDDTDNDRISDADDEEEREQSTIMELKATWLGLSLPVEQSSIMRKWYAEIYN